MVINTPYAAPSAPRVDPFGRLTAEEIQLNLYAKNFPQSARDVHLPENDIVLDHPESQIGVKPI